MNQLSCIDFLDYIPQGAAPVKFTRFELLNS